MSALRAQFESANAFNEEPLASRFAFSRVRADENDGIVIT